MKRELRRWEIVGFIATGLFGTLLHFVYEWSGGNRVVAAFSAINESTWEHMKLLFIPFLVFTVVEFIVFSEAFRNFFAVKAASILLGLVSIPALFYTLTGMLGKLPDWVNITIFFLADELPPADRWRAARGRDAAHRLCAFVGAAVRVCLVYVPPAAPAALFRPRERVLRTGNTVLKKALPRNRQGLYSFYTNSIFCRASAKCVCRKALVIRQNGKNKNQQT